MLRQQLRKTIAVCVLLTTAFYTPPEGRAYSILTHEQIIDLLWFSDIVPFLQSRYPHLNTAQLKAARVYAYGGALFQDAGYYPGGDERLANLTHYVRSGDFVVNLFRSATDVYEMAFAVGALSHYMGDSIGHPEATNPAVAIEFRGQFPDAKSVTYAQNPDDHRQAEFAFDIYAINQQRFAPVSFVTTVGIDVPLQQASYAFFRTYGVDDDFTRKGYGLNLRKYRKKAHELLPSGTYAVAHAHLADVLSEEQTPELQQLKKKVACAALQDDWENYRRSSLQVKLMSTALLIRPTYGYAQIKGPEPDTEQAYVASLMKVLTLMKAILADRTPDALFLPKYPETTDAQHPLANVNLDTGAVESPGAYTLTDDAYIALLKEIALLKTRYANWKIDPETKGDLTRYFSEPWPAALSAEIGSQADSVRANLLVLATVDTTAGFPDHFASGNSRWAEPSPSYAPYPATQCVQ